MKRMLTALVAAFAMSSVCAQTQTGPAVASSAISPSYQSSTATPLAPESPCCALPANTLVDLEILDLLNSARHKRGDRFRLRVVTPVLVNDTLLIRAGTAGLGEIVHAAAARGGGAPGELLIAARSLDVDGRSIALRGLKLGATGGDNSGMALGVSFAAGPFALFIRGHEIEIPTGTRVSARLAQAVTLLPAPSPTPPATVSTKE